jgi:hypothetical protein
MGHQITDAMPHCTAAFSDNGMVMCGSRPEEGSP